MKTSKLCGRLLLFLGMLAIVSSVAAPTISYASSNISTVVPPVGSISGGTVVYIFGTNFSPDPTQVAVRFGSYPCNLKAESSSVNMLTCITSPATNSNSLYGLALTVSIQGQTPLTCSSSNCQFSYSPWKTPIVHELVPKTVAGGDLLNVFGLHRITDTGDGRSAGVGQVTSMLINGYSCSLIDVVQSESINPDYRDNIICRVFSGDEAGEYYFAETVSTGLANSSLRLVQTSPTTGNSYHVRVAAEITQDFPHSGGHNGHRLALTLSSEAADVDKYTCTVAGQTCSVSSVDTVTHKAYVEIPAYDVANINFGALPKSVDDTLPQQSPFLGSNGFRYKRYSLDLWMGLEEWATYLRGPNITLEVLQDEAIYTELGSAETHEDRAFVEHLHGYLWVPKAGLYNFYALADDQLLVKLAKLPSNSHPDNLETIIQGQKYVYDHYDPFVQGSGKLSHSRNFTEAGYYYCEIVSINTGGKAYFKLMWDTPKLNTASPANPTWQIDYFSVTPADILPEIINVTVNTALLGSDSFHLFYYINNGGIFTLQSSKAITAKISAAAFQDKLSTLYTLANYDPVVTLQTFTSAWVADSSAAATIYQYSISLAKWRDTATYNIPLTEPAVQGTAVLISKTQVHSAPIRGTYRLVINNTPVGIWGTSGFTVTSLPYKTNDYDLSSAFNNFYKSGEIEVRQISGSAYDDKLEFVVYYFGVTAPLEIKFDCTSLTGGVNNLFDTNYTIVRKYSTRPFFDPIPYDFLRTAETQPGLYLTLNQVPLLCQDCRYSFNSTLALTVSSASLTGTSLALALSNPNSVTFSLSDVTVSFLGVGCNIQAGGTTSNFNCIFPTAANGAAAIPAGIGKPVVHVRQIGYAVTTSLANISITLQVTAFAPTTAGPAGGLQAQINGTGFPSSNSRSEIGIFLCGNQVVDFTSVSTQQINFLIPAEGSTCNGTSSYIDINGQQFPLTFTYDPTLSPLVSQLSLTSASPVLKQSMVITGSNFGDLAHTQVFLYDVNETQQYELTVQSVTSTTINVILGGGKSGEYNVRVLNKGVGLSFPSPASQFSYRIYVESVTPATGSMGGGFDITITGRNFATADSTNVFVGSAMNSLCTITSITATTIVCTLPPMDSTYTGGAPQNITVTGRAVEESECAGECTFTFDPAVTNNVTQLVTSEIDAGTSVFVSGFNLTGATVTVGGKSATVTNVAADNLTFTYPPLTAGSYDILIRVGNAYAYPPLPTVTNLWLGNGISTSSGSYAGHILTVAGNGMTTTINDNNVFTIRCPVGGIIPLVRLAAAANVHTFQLPANPDIVDQYCYINITQGLTYRNYGYSYSAYHTNSARASIASAATPNNFLLTKTNNTGTIFDKAWADVLDASGAITTSRYTFTITSLNASTYLLSPPSNYLPAGNLKIRAHSTRSGYATISSDVITIPMASAPTGSPLSVSYLGGATYTLSGSGFITNNPENNRVTICGMKAKAVSATTSSLTIEIPPLVTAESQRLYGLAKDGPIYGTPFADTANASKLAFDNSSNTFYSSISTGACFVGVDFGADAVGKISTIRYMGNPAWPITASKITGAIFEGSNDMTTWTTIFTVDNMVHTGWNYWQAAATPPTYRYVRFSHTAQSQCQLAEIAFVGVIYSTFPVDSTTDTLCNVQLLLPTQTLNISSAPITYSPSRTSTLRTVTPSFGPSVGGTEVKFSGSNFGTRVSILIDGVDCPLINQTATEIYCTTGRRPKPSASGNSFQMTSDGNPVILACDGYLYVDRWSAQTTWGGEALPREGDSVYVPKGMTLLVDVSTPKLFTVIVDGGRIIFADESDMTFDASYFLLNGGEFKAGTESAPYQHKLTFTMYGDYYGKQLPTFGNKMIGCKNCKFNMHGVVRIPTWTDLNATILPGDTTLHLNQAVDWLPGESIAVASSSFNHLESEERIIASKSADNKTLTVTVGFEHKHFAGIETYGGEQFIMRAEVSLLTRNIKMQGDPTSNLTKYGSHLMLNGKANNGLEASLSYAEFTNCGQPKIVGRYCTHFHMAGEVPNSFVRGISVHHSFARVLTIHGTHYLLVQKNVGYLVQGHNIFIEDGIETNNIIQDNLMISSLTSFTMLQSDLTVASYWITNPYNTVQRNHAAGGDFYGFWYEIKDHPDGPSATPDVCPTGMRSGISQDNIAHSNIRFGLRIFRLSSRKFPCLPPQDENDIDPYLANPSYESKFTNYTLWKNKECGFLGEELGYTTISNFRTIDSVKGGMQFHKTNFTKELVVATDSVIVGYSSGNGPADLDADYKNARGVIAARTDGLLVQNVQFFNFGPTMTPLQSCSECFDFRLWVTGGKTTFFKNISYNNIQGDYIFWEKWRREIFMDLDGSLLAPAVSALSLPAQSKGSITPYRPSLLIPGHCHHINDSSWDNAIYCDSTITLRGLLFTNARPSIDFQSMNIKVKLLTDPYENFTESVAIEEDFSNEPMIVIKKMSLDIKASWAMPFASGHYYNVHWKWGIDFTHVSLAPSRLWTDADGVVLRFNYTDNRELYQIGKWYQAQLNLPYLMPSPVDIDPASCENGDYFHDSNNSYLFVCVSGRNKTIREWVDVTGIRCLYVCPKDIIGTVRENFTRYWSDVKNWPDNRLPAAGENVFIPEEWNLVLDCDTPIFNHVEVKGYLIFSQLGDNLFQAHTIWVKGKIVIGTAANPYIFNATIVLHGNKTSPYKTIDADASGNKMLVVTGGLEFHGKITDNVWNRLTAIAPAGSTSITVQNTNGWAVGDKLVIAASYSGRNESETVTVTAISGNTVSFTPALVYEHYGASGATITNAYGTLDARSGVGLLNRNIRITRGPDADGWGCRVLIYSYLQIPPVITATAQPIIRNGYAVFDGVQLDGCGQYDTTYAGLKLEKLGSLEPTATLTSITRSSIHSCVGMCVYIDKAHNVTFDNNVMYWARKFIVLVFEVDHYTFTNNFLTAARKRSELQLNGTMLTDDVAIYEQYIKPVYASAKINVSKNLAQGSEGEGFVFPFAPCEYIDSYPFYGNTAGSCQVAFMLDHMEGEDCICSAGLIGYASEIGLMANPPGIQTQLIYQDVFFTDNERGITLRYAHETDDNTVIVRNSYFAGYSRPGCSSCYSDSAISYCKNGYAIRMFSATIGGQTFPLAKKNTGFDVICNQQAFDMKSFFDNVLFENYKYNNPNLPYCSQMSVFKRHNLASDAVASAYLTNTRCLNCDKESWAYFDAPSRSWRGWFGGCGELDCTGPNNYFIHDQDGAFTGSRSQILANNSMIGDYESACSFIPEINGHHCTFEEFAVMEYESIAPDFQSRIMWPVYLHYDGGVWNSTTNGWREWVWNGPEPMNKRLARFVSVVRLRRNYNLTYSSSPPTDSQFQIQKRKLPTGNSSDWVILRIYYPLPNSLEVLVTNKTGTDIIVKPYPILEGVVEDLSKHTSICGANNFHYKNGTIQFVVNGVNNCKVRVKLSNFIQISAALSVSISTFYTNNGPTTFLTNICAFLGIDTGRLKIVSVSSGSVIVTALINDPAVPTADAATTTTDPVAATASLAAMQSALSSGLGSSSLSVGFPLLSYNLTASVFNADGSLYTVSSNVETEDQKIITIVLATVIPVVVITLSIVLFVCIRRMRSKVFHQIVAMHSSQIDLDVSEKKEQVTNNIDSNFDKYDIKIEDIE